MYGQRVRTNLIICVRNCALINYKNQHEKFSKNVYPKSHEDTSSSTTTVIQMRNKQLTKHLFTSPASRTGFKFQKGVKIKQFRIINHDM